MCVFVCVCSCGNRKLEYKHLNKKKGDTHIINTSILLTLARIAAGLFFVLPFQINFMLEIVIVFILLSSYRDE